MAHGLTFGAGFATEGITGVTVLPHSGSYRLMFAVSIFALVIGATVLLLSVVLSFKQRIKKIDIVR